MTRRGTCRFCGQPIVWVRTDAGKSMPLDPMPDPGGSIVALGAVGGRVRAYQLTPTTQQNPAYAGRDRYMPHVATCAGKPSKQRAGKRSSSDGDGTS